MAATAAPTSPPDLDTLAGRVGGLPDLDPQVRPRWKHVALWVFTVGPLLAVALAVWLAAANGQGPSVLDVVLAVSFFAVTGHGVTVGFHRHLTHRSFAARRGVRIALTVAGSLAVEGPVIGWVADHRRHHAFSDRDGDPHSPWRYGDSLPALLRGLWWAHVGWLFEREQTSKERYAPDLLADPDIVRVDRAFPVLTALTVVSPALLGWALSGGNLAAAWSALLWAGLVRIFVLHHVTYAINSICHVVGSRPFTTRDRATNVWPLAVLSFGESWHNAHHADPSCARHGVDPWQLDSSAALVRGMERLGWVSNVRWPDPQRVARRRTKTP